MITLARAAEPAVATATVTCTRRTALGLVGAGMALVAGGWGPALASAPRAALPVTAYFHDGLLHDPSGRLPPWRAPAGHCGAANLAALDEAALRNAGIQF